MTSPRSPQERVDEIVTRFHPHAPIMRVVLDVLAWGVAALTATLLRYGLTLDDEARSGLLRCLPIVIVLQVLAGYSLGLYRRRWRYGSYDEVAALVVTAAVTTTGLYLLNEFYLSSRPIPQSVVLVAGVVGLLLMAGVRYLWRLVQEWMRRPSPDIAQSLLVFGAGEGGLQVITSLLRTRNSPYVPVGILDDDKRRQRLTLRGVPVLGDRTKIREAAARTGAETLLIAIPSASAREITEVSDLAIAAGLTVKVLPPVQELLGSAGVGDIRDLTDEDLLGRRQISTDVDSIAEYITGRRVLVTGAGGSIGSELCRQLNRYAPSELLMLDRDESALHAVQLSIYGRALLDTPDMILADIRDADRMMAIFATHRPDVVFHAAALKHLPLLEQHPSEAYKSNVLGTLNVLRAAEASGVGILVNVSTDKAASPTSVLGYSKRLAERLTAHVAQTSTTGTYLSVRFGNVLGSRGSVLGTFREQIEQGGPVTVTDANVTRFFMTIHEAVELVIQAGAIGCSGEVLVLDMGEPVRIYDVAQRLVRQSRRPIEIVITGLRPGEKPNEVLFGAGEHGTPSQHPLISRVTAPALDPAIVEECVIESREAFAALV